MVDSRQKGARAELKIRDELRSLTGVQFERTPHSGALDAKHGMKGDIYVPSAKNKYAIEVKHYANDCLTSSILTGKDPTILTFWRQAEKQASSTGTLPLLIFKFDRSKIFVAFQDFIPTGEFRVLTVEADDCMFYVSLLTDWVKYAKPQFIL